MSKFFLRFVSICILLAFAFPALGTPNVAAVAEKDITQELTASRGITIQCGKIESLAFSGKPNETQTGEITFTVKATSSLVRLQVIVTGYAFENGVSSLNTEYQPRNGTLWYKAGESFVIPVVCGQTNIIRFRATTGARISSQYAGTFTARLLLQAQKN